MTDCQSCSALCGWKRPPQRNLHGYRRNGALSVLMRPGMPAQTMASLNTWQAAGRAIDRHALDGEAYDASRESIPCCPACQVQGTMKGKSGGAMRLPVGGRTRGGGLTVDLRSGRAIPHPFEFA